MSQTDPVKQPVRRRRSLDISRIKVVVVVISGALIGLLSSLTGQGAHLAYTPALSWMLGFNLEKAHATAMRYALAAALAAVIFYAAGHHVVIYLLQYGVLFFLGATIGALFSAPLNRSSPDSPSRSVFLALAMFLCVFILIRTVRLTPFDLPYFAKWHGVWAMLGAGLVIGALSQLTGIATGILLYPTLIYLFGLTAHDAVITALIVVIFAGILPTWSYGKRGLIDSQYGGATLVGGLVGGFTAAAILGSIHEKLLIVLFSLFSMFLCAREMARLSAASKDPRDNLQI